MGNHVNKPSNKGMVDRLVEHHAFIHSPQVEGVFRAVDRAMYFDLEEGEAIDPYDDDPWRRGNLHLSAPCIYARVVEALDLRSGLSFLNLGSGTGYLNTIIGLLIGPNGLNHGVEFHPDVIEYAYKRLNQFKRESHAVDKYDFSEPIFIKGNCLNINPDSRYDRIYLGAACLPDMEEFMKKLIKPTGGILVMPYENHLMRYTRWAETEWRSEKLMDVNFTLMIRQGDNEPKIDLPLASTRTLKELCRIEIRRQLRDKTNLMDPNLLHSDNIYSRRLRKIQARAKREEILPNLSKANFNCHGTMRHKDNINSDCDWCRDMGSSGVGTSRSQESSHPSTSSNRSIGRVTTRSASRRQLTRGQQVILQEPPAYDMDIVRNLRENSPSENESNISNNIVESSDSGGSDEEGGGGNNNNDNDDEHGYSALHNNCARTRPFVYNTNDRRSSLSIASSIADRVIFNPSALIPLQLRMAQLIDEPATSDSSSSSSSISSVSSSIGRPASSSSSDTSANFRALGPDYHRPVCIGRDLLLDWPGLMRFRQDDEYNLYIRGSQSSTSDSSDSNNRGEVLIYGDTSSSDTGSLASWNDEHYELASRGSSVLNDSEEHSEISSQSFHTPLRSPGGLQEEKDIVIPMGCSRSKSQPKPGTSRDLTATTLDTEDVNSTNHSYPPPSLDISSSSRDETRRRNDVEQNEPVARRLRSKKNKTLVGCGTSSRTNPCRDALIGDGGGLRNSLEQVKDGSSTLHNDDLTIIPNRASSQQQHQKRDCRHRSNCPAHQCRPHPCCSSSSSSSPTRNQHRCVHHSHIKSSRNRYGQPSGAPFLETIANQDMDSAHSSMRLSSEVSSTTSNAHPPRAIQSLGNSSSSGQQVLDSQSSSAFSSSQTVVNRTGPGTAPSLIVNRAPRGSSGDGSSGSSRMVNHQWTKLPDFMLADTDSSTWNPIGTNRTASSRRHHCHFQQRQPRQQQQQQQQQQSDRKLGGSERKRKRHPSPESSEASQASRSGCRLRRRRRCCCNHRRTVLPTSQSTAASSITLPASRSSGSASGGHERLASGPNSTAATRISIAPFNLSLLTSRDLDPPSSIRVQAGGSCSLASSVAGLLQNLRETHGDVGIGMEPQEMKLPSGSRSGHRHHHHHHHHHHHRHHNHHHSCRTHQHRHCRHRCRSSMETNDLDSSPQLMERREDSQEQQHHHHRHHQQPAVKRERKRKRRRANECERYHNHMRSHIRQLALPRVLHSYLNYDRHL